jgi:hypothetical protein
MLGKNHARQLLHLLFGGIAFSHLGDEPLDIGGG